jgi:hypothetical protein
MPLNGAVHKLNDYHDKEQNIFLGLTLKNVMKSFTVTVLVFLNTSHSTEMIIEFSLKGVYSKN